ncbi:MAG: hypothetical protein LBJ97_01750 [Mycoplasmataceae bacterium]|jgi:hypothetical protein|nr:hypothetical protein [Mycoplasmataceae bacterium]
MATSHSNNTKYPLSGTLDITPISFFQKTKYQKQWVKFCKKHGFQDTTLKISDWKFNSTAGGYYNSELGVKLRFGSIPRLFLFFIPILGWIPLAILIGTKGLFVFAKMKTGNIVKVEE